MRKICTSGSTSGCGRYGEINRAAPVERGGNRETKSTATSPHLDSTDFRCPTSASDKANGNELLVAPLAASSLSLPTLHNAGNRRLLFVLLSSRLT